MFYRYYNLLVLPQQFNGHICHLHRSTEMKASVKLRAGERKPPLVRAKIPIIGPVGLPLVASFTASAAGAAVGDPVDLFFHLRTALPGGPSVKISYRPGDPFSPLSLSLLSGVGLWGSPRRSPILFSATLPLAGGGTATGVSFSILLKPEVGDFTFKKTIAVAPSTPVPDPPNPNARIMNGGGVYHPLPMVTPLRAEPPLLEDLFSASGAVVEATTAVPVTSRAALKLRCGLNLPGQMVDPGPRWRLPYLSVNKISFEVMEGETGREESPSMAEVSRARDEDWDLETKGIGYWFRREVEELRSENRMIKEGIEQVWKKVSERRGTFGHGGMIEVSKAALDNKNSSSGRRKWKEES